MREAFPELWPSSMMLTRRTICSPPANDLLASPIRPRPFCWIAITTARCRRKKAAQAALPGAWILARSPAAAVGAVWKARAAIMLAAWLAYRCPLSAQATQNAHFPAGNMWAVSSVPAANYPIASPWWRSPPTPSWAEPSRERSTANTRETALCRTHLPG